MIGEGVRPPGVRYLRYRLGIPNLTLLRLGVEKNIKVILLSYLYKVKELVFSYIYARLILHAVSEMRVSMQRASKKKHQNSRTLYSIQKESGHNRIKSGMCKL